MLTALLTGGTTMTHGDTWCHASPLGAERNQHMAVEAPRVRERSKNLFESMCGWGHPEYTGEAGVSLEEARKSSMLWKVLQRNNAVCLKLISFSPPGMVWGKLSYYTTRVILAKWWLLPGTICNLTGTSYGQCLNLCTWTLPPDCLVRAWAKASPPGLNNLLL